MADSMGRHQLEYPDPATSYGILRPIVQKSFYDPIFLGNRSYWSCLREEHTEQKCKPNHEFDGFNELLGALCDGNIWINLSTPYCCSNFELTYNDLEDQCFFYCCSKPGKNSLQKLLAIYAET